MAIDDSSVDSGSGHVANKMLGLTQTLGNTATGATTARKIKTVDVCEDDTTFFNSTL